MNNYAYAKGGKDETDFSSSFVVHSGRIISHRSASFIADGETATPECAAQRRSTRSSFAASFEFASPNSISAWTSGLQPGETVGWHTTGKNEEALVILHGQGEALIDGQAGQPFVAPAFVYIPPATRHNVLNTGTEPLEYVYVVAPAKL